MESDDSAISDPGVLREFNGVTDPEESALAEYIDFAASNGISGGVLTTVYEDNVGLEVESRFVTKDALSDELVSRLIEETLGQWGDGVGSGDDVISGMPFRACPDRTLVLSVWEDGDTYRVLTSWSPSPRKVAWELKRDEAGRPFRAVRFLS